MLGFVKVYESNLISRIMVRIPGFDIVFNRVRYFCLRRFKKHCPKISCIFSMLVQNVYLKENKIVVKTAIAANLLCR